MVLKSRHYLACVIVCVLLFSVVTPTVDVPSRQEQQQAQHYRIHVKAYTTHDPVLISGNLELAAASVGGTGWAGDPYILEGWNITTPLYDGIYIEDTTSYFVIRDCWINSPINSAIEIQNAAMGTVMIQDNYCIDSRYGIWIKSCENSTVQGNQCYGLMRSIWADECGGTLFANNIVNGSSTDSIYVESSPYCNFTSNICSYANYNQVYSTSHGTGKGIHATSCDHSFFYNNTCINNEYDGLRVTASPSSVLLLNNITGGHYYGIYVSACQDSILANNSVSFNSEEGIMVSQCDSVIVENNSATGNSGGGIHVTLSDSAIIVDNTFTDDGLGVYASSVPDYEAMTISGNMVNQKPYGFFLSVQDIIISADYGQLFFVNCTHVLVIFQNCSYTTNGIEFKWCNGCSVSLSTFNNNDQSGISAKYSNHTIISYVTCNNNGWAGCRLDSTNHAEVLESTLSNSRHGLYLVYSYNSTLIENNTISGNIDYGLSYSLGRYTTAIGNEFWHSGIEFDADSRQDYVDYNETLSGNTVNNKPLAILFDLEYQELSVDYGQLILVDVRNVDIIGKDFSNTVVGLTLYSSSHCRVMDTDASSCSKYGIFGQSNNNITISGCNCTYSLETGIEISSSGNDVIIDNDCSHSKYGMSISSSHARIESNLCRYTERGLRVSACTAPLIIHNDCSYNLGTGMSFSGTNIPIVQENQCNGNLYQGISMDGVTNSVVNGNNCSFNDYHGFFLRDVSSGLFTNNSCYSNGQSGFYFWQMGVHSANCHLTQNFIVDNMEYGIYMDETEYFIIDYNYIAENHLYGVYLDHVLDTTVYHCYFLDNNDGLIQAKDDMSTQTEWYDQYGLEGNFWSDYHGYGPYYIDGSAMAADFCPIVFPDFDGDTLDDTWEIQHGLNPLSPDSDNDLMTDDYEVENGLDPLSDDSLGDADGDSLSNLFEFLNGLKANNTDSDSDAMDDYWEWFNNLDPLSDDSHEDVDADALMNLDEYLQGTNPKSPDSDLDLMTDGFEVLYGLNPLVDDASGDLDEDTLTNLQEYLLGLNPSSVDTDQDLMDDAWEVRHYLNPLMDDASWDPDEDGATNLEEYQAGTNPLVPNTGGGILMTAALLGIGIAGGVLAMVVLFKWRSPEPSK
jgi:parallel beta-helix repeat protein